MKAHHLTRFALVACAATAAASLGGVTSCEDTQSYVYSARKWDPDNACLQAYAPVEVVSGSGVGSRCPAVCLVVGKDTLVSLMCPPLPAIASAADADAGDCIPALAALANGTSCDNPGDAGDVDADDGSSPKAETEAGDEDASADADDGAIPPKDAGDAG